MIAVICGLGICERSQQVESVSVTQLTLTDDGIVGDRHAGRTLIAGPRQRGIVRGTRLDNHRQVSIVSAEENADIARALSLPVLDFTWLSANICLEGVKDLSALPRGSRLRFETGPCLTVTEPNEPCRKAGRVIATRMQAGLESRFVKAAWARRGLLAIVATPGILRLGTHVAIERPEANAKIMRVTRDDDAS
jgi:hypothetical protein